MALLREGGPREWGTNLARVKDYNEVVVLGLVRSSGPIGRPAIAAATGLTLQTVSNISRRLLTAGTILEDPNGGRRKRALRINPDAGYAIGIQLVRSGLAVGVVDLAGEIRARKETPIEAEEEPGTVLQRLVRLVEAAVDGAAVDPQKILGAGIGAPGPLDLRSGTLLNVRHPRSWSNLPLAERVAEALDLKVIMDNDATAAALGEHWRGIGDGAESFVYLYLGTGVGAGLVLDGQAYRGLRGNTGEISHIQVDPQGPPCECGSSGCLGLYTSPDGLLREAARVALEAPANAPVANPPATVEELTSHDDARIRHVVDTAGAHLAKVVAEATRMLDPELIVLGGPLVPSLGKPFAGAIEQELAEIDEPGAPPPRVHLSNSKSDAGVIGAATLVLHDLYAPTARKLSLVSLPPRAKAGRAAA